MITATASSVTDIHGIGPLTAAIIIGRVSVTSAGSRPPDTSPATTAPPRSKRHQDRRNGTGSTRVATANSTMRSTWPLSPRSATRPTAATTTSANKPRARPAKRMRALKRRISDAVYQRLAVDARSST